jgi:two-component system CheB/CheR fusion protein
VQADGERIDLQGIVWPRGATTHWDVSLSPLYDGPDILGVHVTFHDVSREHALVEQAKKMELDLGAAYDELQSTSEELETTNEELQSAVEELETTNEELQSTNEELETMNEELQSTNEELQSLNDELRERTLQSDEANGFLQGILEGLDAALVVVDTAYRVQLWNSGAEQLLGLRAFEAEGLLVLDIELGVPVDELHGALRSVMSGRERRVVLSAPVTDRFGQHHNRVLAVTELQRGEPEARGALLSLVDEPADQAG